MNAATGLSAPLLQAGSLMPAASVSDKTIEVLASLRDHTGYEVFLYNAAPGAQVPDGFESAGGIFARYTNSRYLPFTVWHEAGHHEMRLKRMSAVKLRALYDQVDRREKVSYLQKQNETARKIYGPGAKAVMDSATLRDEFIADMFGVYGYENAHGRLGNLLGQIGVSLETYDAFKALLDNEIFSGAALMEADLRDEAAGMAYDGSGYMGTQTMFAPPRQFDRDAISAIQSIGRKSVNRFTSEDIRKAEPFARRYWKEMGVKSPFFRAWFGDWRAHDTTPVQAAAEQGSERVQQHNGDTGWDINVSGKVFNETRMHQAPQNKAARPYLPYINDIVRKAVLLDSCAIDTNKTKSVNSLMMHSLYAVADIGNGPELMKLYVEEMNDPNIEDTAKRAYQLQNIERWQPSAKGSGDTLAQSIPTANIKTIADLFAAVNGSDKNFKPNPVHPALLNEDGTPLDLYHQTGYEGYVFDPKQDGVAGRYDSEMPHGIFLKTTNADIGIGGNRQVAMWASIKNPLVAQNRTELSAWYKNNVDGYADATNAIEANDQKYGALYEAAEARSDQWYQEHYDELVSGEITDTEADRQMNAELDPILDEWKQSDRKLRAKAKKLLDAYFSSSEFDGIHLIHDGRRNGVDVETWVAFDSTQVKSATDNIGTFDGENKKTLFSSRAFDDDERAVAEPTYSKLAREVEAYKGDKIAASGRVNYLRGRGVKADEIKWLGIEQFFEGRKPVESSLALISKPSRVNR